MKKIFLVIVLSLCCLFLSCNKMTKEEKIESLIDNFMFENLPSYPTYQGIETKIMPVKYDYYTDSTMIELGKKLVALENYKSEYGENEEYTKSWFRIMDSINLMRQVIDTNQQKGYVVTHTYRFTNYRGVYEIDSVNFIVNMSFDRIKLEEYPTMYEEMVMDVYLTTAFTILEDSEFVEMLKEKRNK